MIEIPSTVQHTPTTVFDFGVPHQFGLPPSLREREPIPPILPPPEAPCESERTRAYPSRPHARSSSRSQPCVSRGDCHVQLSPTSSSLPLAIGAYAGDVLALAADFAAATRQVVAAAVKMKAHKKKGKGAASTVGTRYFLARFSYLPFGRAEASIGLPPRALRTPPCCVYHCCVDGRSEKWATTSSADVSVPRLNHYHNSLVFP